MTPNELTIHIEEYLKREKYMQKERITAAYLGALWERVKKMPDLQKIFENEPQLEKPKVQDPVHMLAEVTKLNAAFGGSVV